MWTGIVWMKSIFIVMQQHLKLQEQLLRSWDFLKVIDITTVYQNSELVSFTVDF